MMGFIGFLIRTIICANLMIYAVSEGNYIIGSLALVFAFHAGWRIQENIMYKMMTEAAIAQEVERKNKNNGQ